MKETQKYIDREIVLLQRKVKMRAEGGLEGKRTYLDGFSIIIPDGFSDMSEIEQYAKYPSERRPKKVLVNRKACFTYSKFPVREEFLEQSCVKVKEALIKICPQNVFYEEGDIQMDAGKLCWFDCKGFSLDGSFYCIIFLFDTRKYRIFGNFHCPFHSYDTWKTLVIDMLSSIKVNDVMQDGEGT